MEKDVVYSMRMSSVVREALSRAAKKERRSAASLLDKIITEYLEEEGFLKGPESAGERRRFPREKIPLPSETLLKRGAEAGSFSSVIQDISLGGVLLSYPKGTGISFTCTGKLPDFEVCFELPQSQIRLCFHCDARHMHETGNEIQVGAAFRNPRENDLQELREYIM